MRKFAGMCTAVVCCMFLFTSVSFAGDGVDHKAKVIKLAGFDAVTGKYGNYGASNKVGQEIAVAQINDMGGIQAGPLKGYKLQLDFYDDRGDAREAANVGKKVAAGNYLAVMGPTMSSSALAATPVFNRYRIADIITYANASSITSQGFDNIARLPFTTKTIADAIAKCIGQELGMKTAAVISENQDYGQQLYNGLLEVESKYGVKTVSQDVITAGQDVDFKSVLTRAKSSNPDVLVLFVTYNEGGLIVRQTREMGWEIPIVTVDAMTDPKFFELAGDVRNVSLVISSEIDQTTPQALFLNSEYGKRTGEKVAPTAAVFGYDAVQVARKIIENGATTREEFIKGIQGVEVKGGIFSSLYTFDKYGDAEIFSFVTISAEDYKKTLNIN
jgi:branched-chain amino acid transport system substrate-binding protein